MGVVACNGEKEVMYFMKGNEQMDRRNTGAVAESFKTVEEHRKDIQRILREGVWGAMCRL